MRTPTLSLVIYDIITRRLSFVSVGLFGSWLLCGCVVVCLCLSSPTVCLFDSYSDSLFVGVRVSDSEFLCECVLSDECVWAHRLDGWRACIQLGS
jgi:hypothetical protein